MSCYQDMSRKKITVVLRMSLLQLLFGLLGAPWSPAGAQSGAEHHVIRSEIDGVPLVRTEGAPQHTGPLFEVELDLVIGRESGEPEWQIFWASPDILMAPDGRMVLIEPRRCEVYILSPQGELLVRTGGSGSGPGEYRQPWFTYWDVTGEVVLIDDRALNRATRLSLTGEVLDTVNYGLVSDRAWRYFLPQGNGSYLGYDMDAARSGVTARPHETQKTYCFLDEEFTVIREFMELRYESDFATSEYTGAPIPFARWPDIVPFPDGKLLLFDPEAGRLTVMSSEGEPQLHIEREWERPRVSSADREEARRYYTENDQAYLRRIAKRIPFPDRYPAFSRAFPDAEGRIWVEYVLGPTPAGRTDRYLKYDVFSSEGVWLGVQEFDFYPAVIGGGCVYHRGALVEDEGPRIQRFRLKPLAPGFKWKDDRE